VQVSKRLAEIENSIIRRRVNKRSFCTVSKRRKDRCFLLQDEKFCFIRKKRDTGELVCDVIGLDNTSNFFVDTCPSKLFNVCYVKDEVLRNRSRRKLLTVKDLQHKVACLPYNDESVLFPLLHKLEVEHH